jgi:zinc protease
VKALLLLAAWVGVAAAADELQLPPIARATLDNGMRVVIAEYRELPLVELYLIVGAGAAQDPAGKEGLAALTAGTLTRGTERLSAPALARAIEALGGRIEAAAGTDGTIVSAEFLADDFATGVGLLREVMLEPAFAKDEVRRARDEQVAGIIADLESPSAVADKCFAAFLYGGHPYGRPVEGRRTTVPKLDRGDVRGFHERWYRPNNTILVLVGDVAAPDALLSLREAFGGWKPRPEALPTRAAPPAPLESRRLLLVDQRDATQTQIRLGNLAIARNHPDYLPATVANTILGGGFTSKLIEELRVKRSLTYSAWSAFAARLAGGDFRLGTFTKGPTTTETLGLALEVEGRFRSEPPSPKALAKAKAYLGGQYPLKLESPDALAARLAEIEFHGLPPDELATYRSRVAAVPPEEVAAVASRHMPPPERVAIVVVGKADEIRAGLAAQYPDLREISAESCETLASP